MDHGQWPADRCVLGRTPAAAQRAPLGQAEPVGSGVFEPLSRAVPSQKRFRGLASQKPTVRWGKTALTAWGGGAPWGRRGDVWDIASSLRVPQVPTSCHLSSILNSPFLLKSGTGEKSVRTVTLADVCKVSVRFAVRMCRFEQCRKATGSGICCPNIFEEACVLTELKPWKWKSTSRKPYSFH